MSVLWSCKSEQWCVVFLMLFCICVSFGTEIRSQGNGFYEVRKDTNGLPSVEKRKLKASILCRNQRLTGQQRQMCLRFPLQVAAVFRGYREAVDECKYQFRNERWNCSSLVNMRADTMRPLLASMMRRGFKEVAFVYALIAAAVAKTVSLDCDRGVVTSCDKLGAKNRRSRYADQNEAVAHGLYFSEKFLNSGRSNHDLQDVVVKHNLRAGRLAFTKTIKNLCKCHGITGSCTVQTCARTPPGLRVIGNTIKTLLDNAKKVDSGNRRTSKLNLVLVEESSQATRTTPKHSELVYTEDSPSFCDRDDTLGISGVPGRICSKNPSDINSCRSLCCGQGYHEYWEREESNCECKLKTRFSVHCKKCTRQILVAKCR